MLVQASSSQLGLVKGTIVLQENSITVRLREQHKKIKARRAARWRALSNGMVCCRSTAPENHKVKRELHSPLIDFTTGILIQLDGRNELRRSTGPFQGHGRSNVITLRKLTSIERRCGLFLSSSFFWRIIIKNPHQHIYNNAAPGCQQVLDESRSFFRVHTGYFSNIPKCIKAEFIASWACSQSSVVSSSKR
ncbi:hypothetical protein TNCV_1246351 [Trichonephila clavipes]|uniref:Uncharacterized protein n=1 Tax=Trichonephila clavipes TaxID=2585209 RepID=A0A8X6RAS8_TRICX|nr:hypothetical protein TNCV_1246351 [Trichonephila clavipes]